ncbi:hypothetical protein KGF56_004045 [Candida oxycetoniae]|uniref:L-asparaginase n=1 Tax=Candida oxycetoniae TaxID=497107 RepID=A0AAI9WWH0_9ASCO|nr:uncharacterized protein KGF56_004045 [Candida oxycetoniae]KAI3403156.2 hypothetical protein KGF56_004045 [Candida oxycetoniae]
MKDLLILHIGAGNHNESLNKKYATLIKKALSKNSLIDAAEVLENSALTNTGFGSSLNMLGKVEIDASFISYTADGSEENKPSVKMGSLTGLKCRNPTEEMARIFSEIDQQYGQLDGLVAPISLNCTSLKNYMDINEDDDDDLISIKSYNTFNAYKKDATSNIKEQEVSDTIGLIQINDTEVAMVTSSGGNYFKLPGRIGCAGVMGAAISFKEEQDYMICCMCSGNGEQIIRDHLATSIIEVFDTSEKSNYGQYLEKVLFETDPKFYIGFVVVFKRYDESTATLVYGHSTESFYFGYKVGGDSRAILSFREKKGCFTFGEYLIQL